MSTPEQFYTLYKDYPTTELLKIIRQADDYQAEAVAAAQQVISEREVTAEDVELVDQHYQTIDNAIKEQQQKVDSYKNKVADFLEPVLDPTGRTDPGKWLKFVLLLIIIEYTWSFYRTIVDVVKECRYDHFRYWDVMDYAGLFDLVYVPLIFLLLYKRNRWGWILMFVNNLIIALCGITAPVCSLIYILVKDGSLRYFPFNMFASPYQVLNEIIKVALVVFLWTEPMSDYFGVSHEIKMRCVKVAAVLAAIFTIALLIIMR